MKVLDEIWNPSSDGATLLTAMNWTSHLHSNEYETGRARYKYFHNVQRLVRYTCAVQQYESERDVLDDNADTKCYFATM